MSVACQVNWASNFVVGIGWPYMAKFMGPYSFVAFGALLLATFIFTWQYLPETAGRSVAEVQRAANEPRRRCGGWCGDGGGEIAGGAGDGVRPDDQATGNAMHYVVVEGVDLSMS